MRRLNAQHMTDAIQAATGVAQRVEGPCPGGQVGTAVALVGELLPGAQISHFTSTLLDQAVALNDLQADQLTGRDTIPAVRLYLTSDGPGYCLHQPLREHNARTRALDRWITAIGASHTGCLHGYDAVHFDYRPGRRTSPRTPARRG
jgi:hypothetical protein